MLRQKVPIRIANLIPSKKSNYDDLTDNAIKLSTAHLANRDSSYVIELLPQGKTDITSFFYPVIFTEKQASGEILLPRELRYHLGYKLDKLYSFQLSTITPQNNLAADRVKINITRLIPFQSRKQINLKGTDLIALIRDKFQYFPLCLNQYLYLPYDKTTHIELFIEAISSTAGNNERILSQTSPALFYLDETTKITLHKPFYISNINLDIIPPPIEPDRMAPPPVIDNEELRRQESSPNEPVTFNLDFKAKGIGGLKNELNQIVREVLLSRAMGELYDCYGLPHTKGFILYGPPGTGKTLIAREIGKLYAADHVTVINGPELKSPLVGQSAANLRAAFAVARDAWRRLGKKSQTEVIIIDEIDVVFPRRTAHSAQETGSQVNNDMVAQILTILDGVDSPQNIIVIGTTNRFIALDPALVRPGRLETCIEILLPDKEARYEILCIHTAKLRENRILSNDVDLQEWAANTEYFTGAELMQLVKKAVHYSIQHSFEIDKDNFTLRLKPDVQAINNVPPVTNEHFGFAYQEIKPVNVPAQAVNASPLVSVLRRSGSPVHRLSSERRNDPVNVVEGGLRK